MKFSIIVPSFNQEQFIGDTLRNLAEIKQKASAKGLEIEILVFDSESNTAVQEQINKYRQFIDFLEVEKDKGQYDAINKGILKCTGNYWTWLNTDDLLNVEGFFKLVDILKANTNIDYIYGGVNYINEKGEMTKQYHSYPLDFKILYSHTPAIFQPGSFFKKKFTDKIGLLKPYQCCFDYEYILRCFKNKAVIYCCDFIVSDFRFYKTSKSGSITSIFIKEQLQISKDYGRKFFHFLTPFSYLRLTKHFLFPRK
ncbi:MAG: glycosyltransferase [Bacteroidia bacterium]|nr:glycosyltransferase [Bacteroidia bacterium]